MSTETIINDGYMDVIPGSDGYEGGFTGSSEFGGM